MYKLHIMLASASSAIKNTSSPELRADGSNVHMKC